MHSTFRAGWMGPTDVHRWEKASEVVHGRGQCESCGISIALGARNMARDSLHHQRPRRAEHGARVVTSAASSPCTPSPRMVPPRRQRLNSRTQGRHDRPPPRERAHRWRRDAAGRGRGHCFTHVQPHT
eukprot:366328-Chlamydomonas_euryale.AAC.10